MELVLLDRSFRTLGILDTFDSLIWTDRYDEPGDFNITTYATAKFLSNVVMGYYFWQKESERLMLIEDLWIHTDIQAGNTVILKGRSIESILDRRIVWNQTVFSGSLQDLVLKLLTDSIISPTDTDRRIANFVFQESEDINVTSLEVKAQYIGDNLLTAIQDLCRSANVGFKVTLSEEGQFVFQLYAGVDRSYNQTENPYIVFAPAFDNIVNSDYKLSTTTLKTIALVAGEGEGSDRTMVAVSSFTEGNSGLERREIFTDAGDISRNTQEGTLTEDEYIAQLAQRGYEELAKNQGSNTFEGQVNSDMKQNVYRRDYGLGDVVQVANEYGNEATSRVIEVIYCQDSTGIRTYPTFAAVTS